MTALYRMRTNTAAKRDSTLFEVLVRFNAKERRAPMRRGLLLTDADALRWGWRRRTLRRDCWENASTAMRYNAWDSCKRRAVCSGGPLCIDLRDSILRRALQRPVRCANTVYRTRPFHLRRFLRTAQTHYQRTNNAPTTYAPEGIL